MTEQYKRAITIVAVILLIAASGIIGFMQGRDYQFYQDLGSGIPDTPSTQTELPIPAQPLSQIDTGNYSKNPNPQTVTGEYFTTNDGESDGIQFKVTTGTEIIPTTARFWFQSGAETLLGLSAAGKLGQPGCDYISGKAEVVVTDYMDPDVEDDVLSGARLIKVNKIIQPAQCGRGYYNF